LFCIIILSPILNAIYFKAERNLENYRRMSIAFVGYGFGSLFIGIFFRESLSILGRGIMIASELILKNDR
jgi:hypothetical protein